MNWGQKTLENVREYLSALEQIDALKAQVDQLDRDPQFQKDFEFYQKLQALLSEYGKTLLDAVYAQDPHHPLFQASPQPQSRRGSTRTSSTAVNHRQIYIVTNPHTGEKVKTSSGPNRQIKAWKDQYGKETVQGWRVKFNE